MSNESMKEEFRWPQIKAMDNFIRQTTDESVWMTWIMTVPDEATEEDYRIIARSDELYKSVCDLYVKLVQTRKWCA